MNKRTIRTLLKFAFPLDVALMALVVVDFVFWTSQGMLVLLSLMVLLLLGVVVLLALEDRPRFTRLPVHDEPESPITLIYGSETHGRP